MNGLIQSLSYNVRELSVTVWVFVLLQKTHFLVDWRLLVKECIATQWFQSFFLPITDIATYRLNQPRGQII